MNELKNDSVDHVLHAIGQAQPAPGLETRLLQQLAATPSPAWRFASLRWIVPATLAACVIAGVLMERHPVGSTATHPALSNAVSDHTGADPVRSYAPIVPTAIAARTPTERLPHIRSSQLPALSVSLEKQSNAPRATPQIATTKQEPSYPAPEMPLTEQERLLLQIAHRNDPVQIAMLDPVERELEAARERAETQTFFAPRPLPPAVQHDIEETLAKINQPELIR